MLFSFYEKFNKLNKTIEKMKFVFVNIRGTCCDGKM